MTKSKTWKIQGNYVNFHDFTKKELVDLIEHILFSGLMNYEQIKQVSVAIDFWVDERTPKYSIDRVTGEKFRDD